MKKAILIIGAVVLILIVVGAFAVRALLDPERIRAAIEAQATAAVGQPVAVHEADLRLFPRVGLDLGGVAIGKAREINVGRIRLTTGLGGLLRRRVEDASILIERSQIDMAWALALVGALAGVNSGASTPTSSALAIESIGSLGLRDVTLLAGKHPIILEMDSSLPTGDRLVIKRMHGVSQGSNFDVSGELLSLARPSGALKIDAETLDIDGLLAFLSAATSGSQTAHPSKNTAGSSSPIDIHIDVKAKRGLLLGASLTNLATAARLTNQDAMLDDLSVELFGGRYKGNVAIHQAGGEPRYEWRGSATNFDVPQLVAFAGAAGSITGKLGGTISVTAAGNDPQAAMARARGTARIAITDGKISGLQVVRTVILAFGKPASAQPASSGEAFSRLAATLAIAGTNLSTNDLTFASRDFDMTASGALSLATQAVNFLADVKLSQELSAQAGRDLYRLAREGDRIVLPAKITGSVSSPNVFINVQEALKRALTNRAQDEMKGLFDRLRKRTIK
jgi:uncharacterized protein involved in outer membrane biogenesis